MKALEIARVNLVRLFRDRMGLFFIFLLPFIIIVLLGTMYGGRVAPRVGFVSAGAGPLGAELVTAIGAGPLRLETRAFASEDDARAALQAGTIEMAVVVPAGYDDVLRSGGMVRVRLVGDASRPFVIDSAVSAAVADQAARVTAARLAVREGSTDLEAALRSARDLQGSLASVEVAVTDVGTRTFPEDLGPFSLGAQGQLVLFMFLTSMTAATQLILARQLGVTRRMMATPTTPAAIVVGETLGRFAVAMVQGLFIIVLAALVFGVRWGDPLAAALLVVAFALVGTGVAMVIGVFGQNVDQAGTLGVVLGMLLGALGGAMIPLEILGEPLRTIAFATPHAWALEGFRTLVLRDGTTLDILVPLVVLVGFGVATMALGAWRLRRVLAGG